MLIDIPSEAEINCSAERVFDLIADLRGQVAWLSPSSSFKGTADISGGPVRLGTTYRETAPLGVRTGVVTEFDRPTRITFQQPMTLKMRAGVLGITVRYVLTPHGPITHVSRVSTLDVPGRLAVVTPVIVRASRVESARTVAALKRYADTIGQPRYR